MKDVGRHYGPLKTVCERTVQEIYGAAATIVRPHVVAGPEDPTHRFTFWPVRIDRGGEVIGPHDPNHPFHYIDVRDLVEFFVHLVERDTPGTYNGVGPSVGSVSMAELLYGCRAITNANVSFTWIPEEFLMEHGIRRYPLYFSPIGTFRGASRVSAQRSFAAGLRHRPIAVTAIDTLEWFKQQPAEFRDGLQLNLERDKSALEAWHATGR